MTRGGVTGPGRYTIGKGNKWTHTGRGTRGHTLEGEHVDTHWKVNTWTHTGRGTRGHTLEGEHMDTHWKGNITLF